MLNVHHLELFFYVARHGGISSAVRHMPYGIQQPAVSSQMLQLEKELGTRLFERQPFRLTPAGQELFEFIDPFFGNLEAVAQRLRNGAAPQLRVGASEVVLRSHFPAVLERLQHQHPRVRLSLRSGFDTELAAWLREGQVDLIIMPMPARPPAQTRCRVLLELPLVLLVPKKWKVKTAAEVWSRPPEERPLICMPDRESVTALFQRGLRKRGIEWPVTIEASSLTLITEYVAAGHGAGATLLLPELVEDSHVRVLPLEGFERMTLAALWRGEASPLLHAFVEESQRYATEMWPDWANRQPALAE